MSFITTVRVFSWHRGGSTRFAELWNAEVETCSCRCSKGSERVQEHISAVHVQNSADLTFSIAELDGVSIVNDTNGSEVATVYMGIASIGE